MLDVSEGCRLEVASGIRRGFVVAQRSSGMQELVAARARVACKPLRACSGPAEA